ncbi:MAG: hypothetical protein ACOXZ9_05365 [Bacteroidales bacterium]|jgi:hypothetical protein
MKFKHIDNYTKGLIIGALGVIIMFAPGLLGVKPYFSVGMALCVTALILMGYTYWFKSGEIVENNYLGTGYTKKEDGSCQPEILKPHETRKGIDGVKTPYNTEKVFKICNGIKARITPTGKVEETTLLGKIANVGYTNKFKI